MLFITFYFLIIKSRDKEQDKNRLNQKPTHIKKKQIVLILKRKEIKQGN